MLGQKNAWNISKGADHRDMGKHFYNSIYFAIKFHRNIGFFTRKNTTLLSSGLIKKISLTKHLSGRMYARS